MTFGYLPQIKKYILLIAALFMITTVLTACAGNKQEAGEKEKQLVVAVSSDVAADRLDAASYNGLIQVYPMIYDALVEYGDKGEILPSLAESWNISEDGKVYTFNLRKDVKFSDGTPFDAQAAKFSIERWYKDPANASLGVSTAMRSVEVVDAHTIKLTFDKCYYPILAELTYPRPVRVISPSGVEPAGDVTGKFIKPIGTGAWMVESYTRDQQTVLVPNPNYWGKKPKLSKIVLKVIPDPQSRVMALQSGEVDLSGGRMGTIPMESIASLKNNENLNIESTSSSTSYFLIYNYQNELLQDINVRKAINLAIDRKDMVDNLLGGLGKPSQGLFQFTVPYVTQSNNQWYSYDPAKARAILKDDGFTDTDGDGVLEKGGKKLELNLVLQNAEYPEWKTMCEYVQGKLKEIGIGVNLKLLETNAYYDALWKNRQYDLIIYRTYSDSWNPHGFLMSLFHRSTKAEQSPAVAWSDPELEKLIDQVFGIMDDKERQQKYDQILVMMYQKAMFAPLYYPDEIFAVNKRVSGFAFGSSSYYPAKWEEIDIAQ